MLSFFSNSCRGYVSHRAKRSIRNLRKYTTQPVAVEIPLTETPIAKEPKLIIKCKNSALDFYDAPQNQHNHFTPIVLASRGWLHRKSANDYFILYPDGSPESPSTDLDPTITFEESNLSRQILDNLKENDLKYPSAIQRKSIPVLLSGKNSVIAAETGCGKTLAYLLPVLEQITRWKHLSPDRNVNAPLGLILSPSRDLTSQLGAVAKKIAADTGIKIRVVIGGKTKQLMINPLVDDIDLLIGSFGAVSKLTNSGVYDMTFVRHVVLDEADTLFDESFVAQLRHFLKKIRFSFAGPESPDEFPRSSQMTLVSATMPHSLPEVLDEIVNTDSLTHLTSEKLHYVLPQVTQKFIRLNQSARAPEILRIVKGNIAKGWQTLVFCNTTKSAEWLFLFLSEMGIRCCCTHGAVPARLRLDKFAQFQHGEVSVLTTTDACSRGLDTVNVRHVVNFDFPLYTADYIHRCGRTGRLGNNERCYITNFISSERDVKLLQRIEESIRTSSPLPNVNANITKIIINTIQHNINKAQKQATAHYGADILAKR
ncbi:probable ATP-dependent RNA helicase DDX28 [Athalia rosae]|uniref:probable ATP-dependent RNA helicase DDX28 n=1 Tax=Athalia rosae TaxID=37344 RepID=UPI002033909E|nr:probable ATP-dependent RNA helicase DDX28 [Athalia rosae]